MPRLMFGPGSVDYETRIDWEALRKKRVDRANKFMTKYGIGSAIVYQSDRARYLAGIPAHPYSVQTPKTFLLFIKDAGFPYMQADEMVYSSIKANCPWLEGGC